MFGASRDSDRIRRERQAWFDSLTPEQQRDENEYQDYVGRTLAGSVPLFFFGWMAAAFVADSLIPAFGMIPLTVIAISWVPGSLVCPFFFCIMTKRAWLAARRRCTTDDERPTDKT